jgi:hypothetical protein
VPLEPPCAEACLGHRAFSPCCGSAEVISGPCLSRSAGRGSPRPLGAQARRCTSASLEGDGEAIFRHACALGWKAFISKRRVHVRMADLSKPLAVEDKTAVRPRATYSLPA